MANDFTVAIPVKAFDQFSKTFSKLNNQLKKVGMTSTTTNTKMKTLRASAKKLNTTFNRLAVVGLAVATLGFRKLIMVGAEFEQSIANLSSLTGLHGEDLKTLGESSLEMGKMYGMGASEVANAMIKVGSNRPELLKDTKAMRAVTDASIRMAKISGLDVPVAANALTTSMNAFGLAGKDATEVLDIMAVMAVKGTSPIQYQALAMKEAASTSRLLGFNVKDLSAMIQSLGKQGIHGGRAGRMIRNVLLQVNKVSKGSVTNFKELTAWMARYGKSTNLAGDIATNFGKRNAVGAAAMIEHTEELIKMRAEADKTGYAQRQLTTVQDTLTESWKRFKSSVGAFAIRIFEKHLRAPLRKVIETMTKFVHWLERGSKGARLFLSVIAGIGAGIGALGAVFVAVKIGMFIHSVWALVTAVGALGTGVTIATGGLALLIPAIAGLAFWITSSQDATNRLKNGDKDPLKNQRESVSRTGKAFSTFTDIMGEYKIALDSIFKSVTGFGAGDFLSKLTDSIMGFLFDAINGLLGIPVLFKSMYNSLRDIVLIKTGRKLDIDRNSVISKLDDGMDMNRINAIANRQVFGDTTGTKQLGIGSGVELSGEILGKLMKSSIGDTKKDPKITIEFGNVPAPVRSVNGDTKNIELTAEYLNVGTIANAPQ